MDRASIPPFNQYLGTEIVRKLAGRAELALELGPQHLNRRGVAHGGVISSLLDSALGAAVISGIPERWWCATTSLSTQFLRGATLGRLTATGELVRRGRRVAFATGEVRDERDRLIATAQGTWHLWSQRPTAPADRMEAAVVLRGESRPIRVGKILAVGRNYAEHVEEMGAPAGSPPVVFLKPSTALVCGDGDVAIPTDAGEVHHEVELVAVIGKSGKAIRADDALDHVLGYAVGVDMTLRELQAEAKRRGEPWLPSKGFDGSALVSPVAARDEVPDPANLELSLRVNGRRVQHASTSLMLHGVAELIEHVSRRMTLEQGDLLFTGTPSGVGPVVPGDRLEASLEQVGSLSVRLVAEPD